MTRQQIASATSSASVADILERVLDKGVVIAGDIRVKLVDIELLTIQIRLVVCSIDKAKEIGMDWWNVALTEDPGAATKSSADIKPAIASQPMDDAMLLASRLEELETRLSQVEMTAAPKG